MRYAITGATVQQVKDAGGTDIKEARSAGIIFADLSEDQATKLRSQGCTVTGVGKVQAHLIPVVAPPVPVAAVPTYSPEELNYATGLEDLRTITEPPLYGQGVTIAIIDTGIRETHEKIAGQVVYSKNYTTDPMRDGLNHGTGVCSIALAAAPQANILNLKVLNDRGEGSEEDVVLAIDDCIDFYTTKPEIAPQVINLSLGAPDDGNPSGPMRVACRAAIGKGIWVLASAGNGGPLAETITTPACEKYVGAVGSARYISEQSSFVISDFSSRGPTLGGLIKPDAVFFGEDIVMASSEGDTATIAKSGTSFATPFASGAVALTLEGLGRAARLTSGYEELYQMFLQYPPVASEEELLDLWLPRIATKPAGVVSAKDDDYGWGLPLGSLVAQALGAAPATTASDMLSAVVPIFGIGIVGMMMGSMAKGLQ